MILVLDKVHMLLTPSYGIKNMLETLMVDHLHNYAHLGRSGGAQEPKIWWKLIKNWFFEEKIVYGQG